MGVKGGDVGMVGGLGGNRGMLCLRAGRLEGVGGGGVGG